MCKFLDTQILIFGWDKNTVFDKEKAEKKSFSQKSFCTNRCTLATGGCSSCS
jgi:hypothetical protein